MNPLLIIGLVVALSAAVRGNWSPCGESLQAQLHPLGEKSRGNVWIVTIVSFAMASAFAGAVLGAVAGTIGGIAFNEPAPLWLAASVALTAGALDLSPWRPPTPRRQVNENWIGRYRGWVYGAGFGVQLGLGFTVFVMSWGYYAMLVISLLTGSAAVGAVIGAMFGLGRGILLYLSRRIETPESLVSFHATMARRRNPVFRLTGSIAVLAGLVFLASAL